jgi:response regulator of citrate/malate metabolism
MLKKRAAILLIDDDDIIDFLHRKLLIKAGITAPIIEIHNGKAAIEELFKLNDMLKEDDNVLALLDINMPVLDGWGFLEEFEALIPILKFNFELYIVSASSNTDDVIKSKNYPCVIDYLNKPLNTENINKYLL